MPRGMEDSEKLGGCQEFEFSRKRVQPKEVEGEYITNKLNPWNKILYLLIRFRSGGRH